MALKIEPSRVKAFYPKLKAFTAKSECIIFK